MPESDPTCLWHELEGDTSRLSEPVSVTLTCSAFRKIEAHIYGAPAVEQIGLLLGGRLPGSDGQVTLRIDAALALEASSTLTHVSMHRQAWSTAWKQLNGENMGSKIAAPKIVGWYHSHPGHGVFLSPTDLHTHSHWFAAGGGISLVIDSHTGDVGCFNSHGAIPVRYAAEPATSDVTPRLSSERILLDRRIRSRFIVEVRRTESMIEGCVHAKE